MNAFALDYTGYLRQQLLLRHIYVDNQFLQSSSDGSIAPIFIIQTFP